MSARTAKVLLWAWLKLPLWLFHGPMVLRRLSAWWLPYYGWVAYTLEERAYPDGWGAR